MRQPVPQTVTVNIANMTKIVKVATGIHIKCARHELRFISDWISERENGGVRLWVEGVNETYLSEAA